MPMTHAFDIFPFVMLALGHGWRRDRGLDKELWRLVHKIPEEAHLRHGCGGQGLQECVQRGFRSINRRSSWEIGTGRRAR